MFIVLVILLTALLAWACQAIRPPPPRICGSPSGPPVTAPRIKLRDGRHLAYKEHGVSKEVARFNIIYIHGFRTCRHDVVIAVNLPPGFFEELGLCVVSYDRPGYGESDPNPKQTVKSLVLDIEELADQLGLGSKFYVIGNSIGAQLVWGCLKYIPHRLAGAALLSPVVNYWWQGFPANLLREAYHKELAQDQWALRVAHYIPWLTYCWNTQKWFPGASAVVGNFNTLSPHDVQLISKIVRTKTTKAQATQQGVFESMHRTLMIGVGNWEFSPLMDLENPFPNNEGSVHLWQGDGDRIVPVKLQRYIANKLPWIKYHELPGSGHFFPCAVGMGEVVIRALLSGDKKPTFDCIG
ncbi:uncharacterized protein LOC133880031 [Alnus glutinosa]|uniref:uncharacterized protein LOC133880031 n=1 Tax=Alnus glutinosa TaxID=3517 RepID=UPI002D77F81F|nr:uncharacterized protein LOC133880031 [Alnus glutinosa]